MKDLTFKMTMNNNAIIKKSNHIITYENTIEHSIIDKTESSNSYLLMNSSDNMSVSRSLTHSQVNNMVMIEAKRLVMNEKINSIRWKRQQKLLEMELKKFQNKLYSTRPKFTVLHEDNSDKTQFNSLIDDTEFFTIHKKLNITKSKINEYDNLYLKEIIHKDELIIDEDDDDDDHHQHNNQTEVQNEFISDTNGITVVIKDKPSVILPEENLKILKWAFDCLRNYVFEIKRLKQIKEKIQLNIMTGKLRRFFNAWRNKVKCMKQLAAKNKEEYEIRGEKKIEIFVNMIKEKQKILDKNIINSTLIKKNNTNQDNITWDVVDKNKSTHKLHIINTTEPFNNRLKAQKKIITEQKMKLAEQNRLIEEMKLKQIEIESRLSGIETINIAKTILNCGSKSQKLFMSRFIPENNYVKEKNVRSFNSSSSSSSSSSSIFPQHLEARAVTRREKIRERQIKNEKKLYEEKLKQETMKIEEEKLRKQAQRDAERKLKMIRDEQERKKAENIKRLKIKNELADKFYRKYLLRNYIMKPLILLLQITHNRIIMAAKYYDTCQLKKTFIAWKVEIKQQLQNKFELAISMYNRNILIYYFQQWRAITKNEIQKYQVACDRYDLHLLEKYLNIWILMMIEIRMKNIANEKISVNFYERLIKKNYFIQWKKYMTISDGVKESDKRRDQWRQLVRMVIPDYAPKHRGVIIDD